MRQFHHIGVISRRPRRGEIYIPAIKAYLTNPNTHPDRLKYLRFEADSPLPQALRTSPHVAFKVPRLEVEMAKGQVLWGPFEPMPGLRAVFVLFQGAIFEFLEFSDHHVFAAPEPRRSAAAIGASKPARRRISS